MHKEIEEKSITDEEIVETFYRYHDGHMKAYK